MKKITLLFFMLCSIAGYSQLAMEGFEGTFPPDQWSIYNIAGPAQTWIQGAVANGQPAHEGTKTAYINREQMPDGTFSEDFLVTKPFLVPANPQVRFWSRLTIAGNQGNTYKVMVLPPTGNAANPADYILLEDWTEPQINPSNEEWNLVTVSNATFAGYTGQTVRIAFVMLGDFGDRWQLDEVEVVSECLVPTNLTANNITQTAATLSWGNPSGATAWEIEILENTAAPTGVGTTITTMPYTVTGLNPDTCYKYYVKAECTATNESEWEGPYTFCTVAPGATCNAPWVVATLPFCITDNTGNFGDDFDGSPGSTGCGTTNGYLNGDDVVYAYTAPANGVISIDATGLGDFAGMFVYDDCADIGVSCIGGGTGGPTTPISIPSLSVTAGTTYYVVISTWAFPQTTPYNICIQQVNCAPPVGLPTTNVGQTSADLSWTNPSGATSWEVVVQAPGAGIPPGAGTTVSTNTNYPATGLTPATPYEYWVRAACGGGLFSAWAGPYLFNTTICEPAQQCNYSFVMNDSWGDGWNGNTMTVSQNGITIATLGPTFTTGQGPITITVPVCDGLPLNLFWNSGGAFANEVGVSIQNNFGQTIYTKPSGTGSQNSLLYTTTIDCDTPACLPPSGLTATNIGMTTADLNWAGPATGNWDYYVVPAGSPAPTAATPGINTTTKPVTATGLTAGSNYQYYVRIVCDATSSSAWAGPFNFTTAACEVVDQCAYTFIMTDSWGDGWNGNTMTISQNGATLATIGSTFTTGQGPVSVTIPICDDLPLELFWNAGGAFANEVGIAIQNNFGQTMYTKAPGTGSQNSLLYTTTIDCDNPACLAPTNLTATNITTTTALLGWAGPATGNWEYIVLPAGSPAPTDATPGTATPSNPVTATGLTAATNYEYYVRVVCSPTQNSPWAGPFAFNTTPCEAVNQCNYVFEMTALFWGWNGNTMTITQGGVHVATIGGSFTSGTGPVTVEVPLCHNMPFEIFWNSGPVWSTGEIGLTVYTPFAEDIFIKPPGEGTPNSVIFSGTATCDPPLCPKPQDLLVNDIQQTSVELNWTEMGSATSWEVEIVELGSEPTGAGTVVTTNPFVWNTGLESGTTYEFYVRALCGGTNGNSTWSGPRIFTTAIENDECIGAITAPVNPGGECIEYASGTLTGATGSTQAQSCVTWMDIEWDVWYSFTATATTHAVAITDQVGAFYQTVIYAGDDCGSLTQLACGDDNQVITGLTIGETYYVQVYTTWLPNPTAPTSFHICVQTPVPPISVSDTLYTVPELVEDVLIDAECALVSNITWSTGSNFGQANGIGYFNQNGSDFPFEEGIVLATGGITEAPGPWPGVSTFDNPGWPGDADLSAIIAAGGQTGALNNASKLEFDFVPTIDQLSFEFIFASSEYGTFQCFFSDAFAFILTDLDAGGTPVPVNLAVIPTTTIPVSVVNIRNNLYNAGCPSANEEYFDQYNPNNPNNSAIGYNGQTVVMTAQSAVIPGHQYHIKMVIADYSDSAVNSAVFIGGGTFNFGEIDLGDAMLEFTGTAACDGETVVLDTGMDPDLYDFVWTQDGGVMAGQTGPTLNVTVEGVYAVEATFEGTDCAANGEVLIQFYDPIEVIANDPLDLNICDASGFASFDLEQNTPVVLGVLPATTAVTYYLSQSDAEQEINALTSPYTNVVQYQQPIFVRIETVSGCVGYKSFDLNVEDLTPDFDIPATLALCEGGTGTITVIPGNFDPMGANVSFTWTHDGAPLTETGASISVTEPGVYEVLVNNTGCTATASTTVSVSPTPDASISYAGTPYCSNGGVANVTQIGNTGGIYSGTPVSGTGVMVINADTGDIDLAASDAGTYTVTYTIAETATCDEFIAETTVVITDLPVADFTYDAAEFCVNFGSTVPPSFVPGGVAGEFSATPAGLDINPLTGVINPATSAPDQTYTVINTIAAANGCDVVVSQSVMITINGAPIPDFSYSMLEYCQDGDTNPEPIFTTGEAGTFESNNDDLVIDSITGIIDLAASEPGTYVVENVIAATAECNEVRFPVTITIHATPVFTLGGPYNVCDAQFATITVDAENFNAANATYAWTLDGVALPDTGSSITASGFGTYEVTVTTEHGCAAPQSVAVTQNTANVEFSFFDVCEANVYSLEVESVNGSFNPDTAAFTWTGPEGFVAPAPGTVGMATIMPDRAGIYTVSFVTPEGCIGTLPYEVLSTSCFVQNGISPGDADDNNTFDLTALDVISISIFNRYGQEVFSYGAYTNQWGGQDNSGNELPTGTYFYSFERSNGETKTGWIYVNRQN